MAKATYEGPEEALALFEAVVAGNPDVDRKGAKNPYTSRNGHMFCFLDADGGLALRLSDELRDEFAEEYAAEPVEQYGATMRGYVAIPDQLLRDTKKLQPWFDRSHEWIGTLKPKPTTRKKKK